MWWILVDLLRYRCAYHDSVPRLKMLSVVVVGHSLALV